MKTSTTVARTAAALAAFVAVLMASDLSGESAAPLVAAPSPVLTSGGENVPSPPHRPGESAAPASDGARTGAQPDKAELAQAFRVLLGAVGLSPQDLAGCAPATAAAGRTSDGCSAKPPADPASTITVANHAFGSQLTVAPGTTVTVLNQDAAPHNVTSSPAGTFSTGDLPPGEQATFTAPKAPGRYEFVCTIHPDMTSVLVVSSRSVDGASATRAPTRDTRGQGSTTAHPGGKPAPGKAAPTGAAPPPAPASAY